MLDMRAAQTTRELAKQKLCSSRCTHHQLRLQSITCNAQYSKVKTLLGHLCMR